MFLYCDLCIFKKGVMTDTMNTVDMQHLLWCDCITVTAPQSQGPKDTLRSNNITL